uniref:Limbic system associated membrane protein n=1 Tax=Erpetoichthys calabaricus TaxID=27687 RepID=A0A8C4RFJ4_ERPCA
MYTIFLYCSQFLQRTMYKASCSPEVQTRLLVQAVPVLHLTKLYFCFLRCYVDDNVSKVAWLNRSNIIFAREDKWSLDPRVDLVTKGQLEYSLRIQKVDVYDEGPYTCSVQSQQQPKTSQVHLIVQVPPRIYNISSDITVNEGSNVTLRCLASGRPEPMVNWRHLTPLEKSIGFIKELDGDEYLEISGVTREQAGRYECKASSDGLAPDVKYVNVVVNYPPQIMESMNAEIEVGRTGVLQCDALAVPKPDFEWYRDDKRNRLHEGGLRNYGTHSVLTVANVTEDHYGNYTCVATNKLGINNASLFLFSKMKTAKILTVNKGNGDCKKLWIDVCAFKHKSCMVMLLLCICELSKHNDPVFSEKLRI